MSATWKRAHGRPVSNWIREPVSAAAVASWPGPVWLAVQDDRLPVREALRESRHAGDGPQRARQRPGSAPIGAPPVPSPRPGVGSSVGYCPSTSRQDPGLVGFRRAGHAPRRRNSTGNPAQGPRQRLQLAAPSAAAAGKTIEIRSKGPARAPARPARPDWTWLSSRSSAAIRSTATPLRPADWGVMPLRRLALVSGAIGSPEPDAFISWRRPTSRRGRAAFTCSLRPASTGTAPWRS